MKRGGKSTIQVGDATTVTGREGNNTIIVLASLPPTGVTPSTPILSHPGPRSDRGGSVGYLHWLMVGSERSSQKLCSETVHLATDENL